MIVCQERGPANLGLVRQLDGEDLCEDCGAADTKLGFEHH